MIAVKVRFDPHDDVRQRSVRAVCKSMLIVDLVDGIRRDKSQADKLFKLLNNLIQRKHDYENSAPSILGISGCGEPLELQMTSTRDQDITAGEHARFIARQECNSPGHILRVEVSLQQAGLTYPLPVLFRHNHRSIRQGKGRGHNVNRYT